MESPVSIKIDVRVDTATARLIAAARATQACENLPTDSAKTLVARARGVRLYIEARQPVLAQAALDDVEKLMAGVDDLDLRAAFRDLATEVRRALDWSERPAA